MATSVIFKLREPQNGVSPGKQKKTMVIMYFSYGFQETNTDGSKRYLPLKYATGEKIFPFYWRDRPHYRAKQTIEFDYESFNTRLDNIENAVKTAYRNELNKGVMPRPERLRKILQEMIEGKVEQAPKSLNQFLKKYVEEDMKTGKRLTEHGEVFKYGTIRSYTGFWQQFQKYQEYIGRELNWEDIDLDFYDGWLQFFLEKNYSANTIGKHTKTLKTLMRIAREEGLHNNMETDKRRFRPISSPVQNIYLTEKEVESLYRLDLGFDLSMAEIRDVFLVGCYTAQRFSDYSRITPDNVRKVSGSWVIDITQRKTSERVVVPVRPELLTILNRHNFRLPKLYEQKVNSEIKHICRLAGITEVISIEKVRGGKKITVTVQKCTLVKTHTARRTGATNMYLAGIPTLAIMKFTGHKTESEFLKYINVTREETARIHASHPYFKGNPLKIASK